LNAKHTVRIGGHKREKRAYLHTKLFECVQCKRRV